MIFLYKIHSSRKSYREENKVKVGKVKSSSVTLSSDNSVFVLLLVCLFFILSTNNWLTCLLVNLSIKEMFFFLYPSVTLSLYYSVSKLFNHLVYSNGDNHNNELWALRSLTAINEKTAGRKSCGQFLSFSVRSLIT